MSAGDELVKLSVALVTRNNAGSLRRCLESLRAQSIQPAEVVVSDDSETAYIPRTRRVAAEFGCRHVEGPRRGLYANRNFAALQCTGTHIRTMDEDHTFPPGHFAKCIEAVRGDPQAIWTTGETTYIDNAIYYQTEQAAQLHPSGVGCPVSDPDDNWAIADGSTIYPRMLFEEGARMVEDYNYGSSYLEFGACAYARGFRSRCVPGAAVGHHADKGMLERARNPEVIESLLFASLCYNLCFRPNRLLAFKYSAAHFLHSGFDVRLLGRIPALSAKAMARWAAINQRGEA